VNKREECKVNKIENLLKEKGLKNAREYVQKFPEQYKDEIKEFILKQKPEGIVFGRFYLNDAEIKDMLYVIIDNERLDLFTRIQALYEILEEAATSEVQKETWLKYLFENIDKFRELCIKAYEINEKHKRDAYFENLISIKIPDAHPNKKWVYFVELAALFRDMRQTKEIINNYVKDSDKFVNKAANQCLKYLSVK